MRFLATAILFWKHDYVSGGPVRALDLQYLACRWFRLVFSVLCKNKLKIGAPIALKLRANLLNSVLTVKRVVPDLIGDFSALRFPDPAPDGFQHRKSLVNSAIGTPRK